MKGEDIGKDVRTIHLPLLILIILISTTFLTPFGNENVGAVNPSIAVWSQFGNDTSRTGQSGFYMGSNIGETLWTCDVGPVQSCSPCISNTGMIYIGSRDFNMRAVSSDGREIWKYECGDEIVSSPALDEQGNLYFGCLDGYLYSLYPNGTLNWQTYLGDEIRSSPLYTPSGNIIIGSDNGKVYSIDPDGVVDWTYVAGGMVRSSPSMLSDGRIVFSCMDQFLYCLYRNGTLCWIGDLLASSLSTALVLPDDRIVVGSHIGSLFCFWSNGTMKWKYDTDEKVASSPSLGREGNIYFGNDEGLVFRLKTDGTEDETYDAKSEVRSSACISKEGRLVLGTHSGTLLCFFKDLDIYWSVRLDSEVSSSPVIGEKGVVYVVSNFGTLYALSTKPREKPSAPMNLTATVTDSDVLLSWDPPLKLGNQSLTGYKVHRKRDLNGDTELIATLGPDENALLDNSVIPGDVYTYWINAVNSLGESPDSNPQSVFVTISKEPPSPPRYLRASATTTTVTLSWTEPKDEGTSFIKGYYVLQYSNIYELEMKYDVGNVLEHRISGLEQGRNYVFAVSAYNEDLEGDKSGYQIVRLKVNVDVDADDDDMTIDGGENSEDNEAVLCCFLSLGAAILIPVILLALVANMKKKEKRETKKIEPKRKPIQHTIKEGHTTAKVEKPPKKKEKVRSKNQIEHPSIQKPEMPVSAGSSMTDDMIVERILELNDMLDEGIIDQEEYSVMKKRLVSRINN